MTARVAADHMASLVQFAQLGARAKRGSVDVVGGDEEPATPAATFELLRDVRNGRDASIVECDQPRVARCTT